ncbi:hypothetical protein ACHQM5_007013 [Ranunculus cassubicifolius]
MGKQISSDNLCSSKQPDTMPHYGIHDELMDDWEKELQGTGDIVISDEVDSYLIDRLEANDKTARRFDILGWWKIKGMNSYPTLALVARDILAIQVSTVASESAFSTGGRVIDPFRSSLTPKSVEALICFQNWLGSEEIYNIEYEASQTEMEFYQELEMEHEREKEEQRSSSAQASSGVVMI